MEAQGCDEVVLETEVTNVNAQRLYSNLGFIREKRLVRYAYSIVLLVKVLCEHIRLQILLEWWRRFSLEIIFLVAYGCRKESILRVDLVSAQSQTAVLTERCIYYLAQS
ncbi:unnamed protein product [Cylicostephanus goldi]|uniref:N-acetyltransferase domain-containing protein n=1 Tax=Cylicostephanus goldi TaxID=71465 RepID=A0A3P6TFY5_CYLGO|nr:unnamed protein product [Cylicostephanus goldi]